GAVVASGARRRPRRLSAAGSERRAATGRYRATLEMRLKQAQAERLVDVGGHFASLRKEAGGIEGPA
ncbi:MAG TPA: hypothetical protein VEB21_02920, partial [Terriglobales bacterium]|nr:hypothetical protein [Terriglobales bacterium]